MKVVWILEVTKPNSLSYGQQKIIAFLLYVSFLSPKVMAELADQVKIDVIVGIFHSNTATINDFISTKNSRNRFLLVLQRRL